MQYTIGSYYENVMHAVGDCLDNSPNVTCRKGSPVIDEKTEKVHFWKWKVLAIGRLDLLLEDVDIFEEWVKENINHPVVRRGSLLFFSNREEAMNMASSQIEKKPCILR